MMLVEEICGSDGVGCNRVEGSPAGNGIVRVEAIAWEIHHQLLLLVIVDVHGGHQARVNGVELLPTAGLGPGPEASLPSRIMASVRAVTINDGEIIRVVKG